MERRGFLQVIAIAGDPWLRPPPPKYDVLLCGDSLAYQLGPRLIRAGHAAGLRIKAEGRGGTNTAQWAGGWFTRALERCKAPSVVVSLGLNDAGVKPNRLAFPKHARQIWEQAAWRGRRLIWLLPPAVFYRTEYIREGVAAAGIESFDTLPLHLVVPPHDVHPTSASYEKLAQALVQRIKLG